MITNEKLNKYGCYKLLQIKLLIVFGDLKHKHVSHLRSAIFPSKLRGVCFLGKHVLINVFTYSKEDVEDIRCFFEVARL